MRTDRLMASSLGGNVVAGKIEMRTCRARAADSLQQQAQRHAVRAIQAVEFMSRAPKPRPIRQSGPELRFLLKASFGDVETHLVHQAVLAVGPDQRLRAHAFAMMGDQAERQPAGRFENNERAVIGGNSCTEGNGPDGGGARVGHVKIDVDSARS